MGVRTLTVYDIVVVIEYGVLLERKLRTKLSYCRENWVTLEVEIVNFMSYPDSLPALHASIV